MYKINNVTRFVVLFTGRTGSTFLLGMMKPHPEIRFLEEILDDDHGKNEISDQVRKVEHAFTNPPSSMYRALGFKTKFYDIKDTDSFCKRLQQHNAKIIHMRRRNVVKGGISNLRAIALRKKQGQYNIQYKSEQLDSIKIDPKTLSQEIKGRADQERMIRDFISESNLESMDLFYEDLLTNRSKTIKSFSNFVGITTYIFNPDTEKNTSDDLRQAVTNFDELKKHYQSTEYEPLLNEVLQIG